MRLRYVVGAVSLLAVLLVVWMRVNYRQNEPARQASVKATHERTMLLSKCFLTEADPKPCHEVIARYPELRSEAHQRLAMMYLLQRDFKNALIEAENAVQADPKAPGAYIARAEAFMGIREPTRAIADLTTAIALDPNNYRPYANRGLYHALSGNDEAGIKDMQTALALNPRHEQTQAFLAQAMKRKAEREEKAAQGK